MATIIASTSWLFCLWILSNIKFLYQKMTLVSQNNRRAGKYIYMCFSRRNKIHRHSNTGPSPFSEVYSLPMVPRVLWYRCIYFVCSYTLQSHPPVFLFIYHKHNSHIYRNVRSGHSVQMSWIFVSTHIFYLLLKNSGHFYFTLIPCFVKCPIIKP
jgi:hypothetical protein